MEQKGRSFKEKSVKGHVSKFRFINEIQLIMNFYLFLNILAGKFQKFKEKLMTNLLFIVDDFLKYCYTVNS